VLGQVKRVFKDSVIYGLGSLLPKAAGFLLVPVYTRFMSPTNYGILSMTSIIASAMGALLMLGQNGSVTRFFRTSGKDSDPEELKKMLFTVTVTVIAFGLAVTGLTFVIGPVLFPSLVKDPEFTFFPFVAVAVAGAYLSGPMLIWQAVARAQRKSVRYVTVQLSNFAVNVTMSLLLVVVFGLGALGSLWGTLIAAAVFAPLSLWFMRHDLTPRFSWTWLKRSLIFGVPLVPHYFAGWILSFADRYILERYTSLAQVGIYSLAYNVAMVLSFVAMSVNQAWTPIFYDMVESKEDVKTLPRLTTVYATGITVLCAAFLLGSRTLLVALTPDKYHLAAAIVPIVCAGYYMQAMYFVTSTTMFYERKTKYIPLISAFAAAVNIGLNLWLVPTYGIFAAAWATFAAFGVMFVITWVYSRTLRPGIFEDGRLFAVVGIFALAWLADAGISSFTTPLQPLGVILRIGAMMLLPVLVVVTGIVSVDEVKMLVDRVRRRRIKVTEAAEEAVETQAVDADGQSPDDTGVG